jgi:hypothetical protein
MSPHPSAATLESFLVNRLSWVEMKSVVRHLLRGCDRCRQEIAPAARAILSSRWPEREPTPEEDAAYDAAISAACRRVLEILRKERKTAIGRRTLDNLTRRARESGVTVGRS